jgi:phosphoglycerate dehydrogenase-like enzyme
MSGSDLSRRGFIAATGTASAAVAGVRKPVMFPPFAAVPVHSHGDPIRLVTTRSLETREVQQLQEAAAPTKLEVILCKDNDEFLEKLPVAEVVYGRVHGADLVKASKLQWVQNSGAGVDFLMADEEFRQSPIALTNFARTFAPAISETAIGLLLSLTRGLTKHYNPQFAKRALKSVGTVKSDDHVELDGRTMGIVGLGGIGDAIARRAHFGFNMRVVATDAKPLPKPGHVAELHDPGWFNTMVPQVDVLVSAAPWVPSTDRIFNEDVFRSMKETAYFLGMSRGKLIDDVALVKALKEGWIAGAGLDVFPQEPPPADHAIYTCDNVVMTPHTSGWSPDRQIRLMALFAENIRRYSRGIALINVVNKEQMF